MQNILMDCEKNVKIEMENTVRDQGLAELEISKLEEKLRSSRKECEELKHTIVGWIERDKRGKALYDEVCEENSEMANTILDLNEEISEMKHKNSENERLVVSVSHEKFQCLEANEKLKSELSELNSRLSSSVSEKEELLGRYNTLAEDHKKLDSLLIKALSRGIKQNEGPSKSETILGKVSSAQTKKRYRTQGSPLRSSLKRKRSKYISDDDDEVLPIDEKRNPVLESDSEDETFSPDPKEGDDMPSDEAELGTPAHKLPYYSTCQSIITPDHIQELRELMGIPHEYEIVIPSPEDRPDHPPPGFLRFFFHQLKCGLRFPIPPLFSDISRFFGIPLCQLTPNSFFLMAGFAMAVLYLGEQPTARLFHAYYHLKPSEDGAFYFTSRLKARFLKGKWRTKSWKDLYFYISSPQPWNFPTIWKESLPEWGKNAVPCQDPAFESLLKRLNQNPYDFTRLVEPGLLYHFGLSPLRVKLLKPIGEIMAGKLMKGEAVLSPPTPLAPAVRTLEHPDEAVEDCSPTGTTSSYCRLLEEVD